MVGLVAMVREVTSSFFTLIVQLEVRPFTVVAVMTVVP